MALDHTTKLHFPDLPRAEGLLMLEDLGTENASYEEGAASTGLLGEPATIVLIVGVTATAIKTLADVLAARRRASQPAAATFERIVEIEYPDGRRVRETLRVAPPAEGESESDAVLRGLSQLPGIEDIAG